MKKIMYTENYEVEILKAIDLAKASLFQKQQKLYLDLKRIITNVPSSLFEGKKWNEPLDIIETIDGKFYINNPQRTKGFSDIDNARVYCRHDVSVGYNWLTNID